MTTITKGEVLDVQANGLKIIHCPHGIDRNMLRVSLDDKVSLVLCGRCRQTVEGALLASLFQNAITNAVGGSSFHRAIKTADVTGNVSGDERTDELRIAFGTAVKALDEEGHIGGYLVVWGDRDDRDLQGEYFTADTDFSLEMFPVRPALYHHGLDATMQVKQVGTIQSIKADDVGLWAEAQLDLHDRYVQAIHNLVKRGALSWSSGSVPHWVQVDPDGHIRRWPIVEGSLTPSPAQPPTGDHTTLITTLKALRELVEPIGLDDGPDGAEPPESEAPVRAPIVPTFPSVRGKAMTPEQLNQMVSAILDMLIQSMGVEVSPEQRQGLVTQVVEQMQPQAEAAMAAPDPVQAEVFGKAVTEAVQKAMGSVIAQKAALDAAKAIKPQPQSAVPLGFNANAAGRGTDARIQMRTKYHGLSAEDMSFVAWTRANVRRIAGQTAAPLSEAFLRELADKAKKAYDGGQIHLTNAAAKAVDLLTDQGTDFDAALLAGKAYLDAFKSDELDYSTQASYGDEWVPDLWSNQLWESVEQDNVVAPLFDMIDMPSNPFEIPLQGADPTVYYIDETQDEDELTLGSGNPTPDSKMGTSKVTLTAKLLSLRHGFSAVLEEDSIIPYSARARVRALRAMENAVDNVLLNGDDTASPTTTNINNDGEAATAKSRWLAFDGLRHLPLVTTTANAISAAGASPTLALLRQARFALARALAARPTDLAWITNTETYAKLLGINEVLTIDKYGQNATVLTGELAKIDGIPVLLSAELALAASNGKVHYNTGNSYGAAVCVHRPSWMVGYRRRVKATLEFISYTDSYQLVTNLRIAFARQGDDCASILYYIGV